MVSRSPIMKASIKGVSLPRTALSDRSAILWILAFGLSIGLPTLIYPLARDQGLFAYVGERLFRGETLYVDIWDVKSPLIYWTFGLYGRLTGGTEIGYRFCDLLFTLSCALLTFLLTKRIATEAPSRAGLMAGLVYLAWVYLPTDFRALGNCDHYITPFALGAAILLVDSLRAPNRKNLIASGALIALATLYKTTAVVFAAPAVVALIWPCADTQHGLRQRLGDCAGWIAGFATLMALGALWLVVDGAWAEWRYLNLTFLPAYTKLSHAGGVGSTLVTGAYFTRDALALYPALALGAIVTILTFRRRLPSGARFVLLMALAYIGVVILQGKYLVYHFMPFLPFCAALVAVGVSHTLERADRSVWLKLTAALTLALGLAYATRLPGRYADVFDYIRATDNHAAYYAKLTRGNYPLADTRATVNYITQRSEPNDELFVWAFSPDIYFGTGLDHASRFLFNTPLLSEACNPVWKDELLASLVVRQPRFFVTATDDGLPLILGETYSSDERMRDIPGLVAWVELHYAESARFGKFIVYERPEFADNSTGAAGFIHLTLRGSGRHHTLGVKTQS